MVCGQAVAIRGQCPPAVFEPAAPAAPVDPVSLHRDSAPPGECEALIGWWGSAGGIDRLQATMEESSETQPGFGSHGGDSRERPLGLSPGTLVCLLS